MSNASSLPLGLQSPAARTQEVCVRCIMDTSDPQITFNAEGVCNHCTGYESRAIGRMRTGEQAERELAAIVERIKREGQGKDYDCIIGVSGGVDSTYVAYLMKKYGLRALAVHFDNGWDSELAVQNIENTLKALGIDLYTYVMDWPEFRDLQISFLKGSVANWEIPTDHAITALLFKMAAKYRVRYVITGSNMATESIMPAAWQENNRDLRFIKSVHREFGTKPLKHYPKLSLLNLVYYQFVKRIVFFPILNYVEYKKEDVITLIQEKLGYRPYEFKHGESIFTHFFQCFYLPQKFGFDKRKAHLSSLIVSGQMSRNTALAEMNKPLYRPQALEEEIVYVTKKLGVGRPEFDRLMQQPRRGIESYASNEWAFRRLMRSAQRAKKFIFRA